MAVTPTLTSAFSAPAPAAVSFKAVDYLHGKEADFRKQFQEKIAAARKIQPGAVRTTEVDSAWQQLLKFASEYDAGFIKPGMFRNGIVDEKNNTATPGKQPGITHDAANFLKLMGDHIDWLGLGGNQEKSMDSVIAGYVGDGSTPPPFAQDPMSVQADTMGAAEAEAEAEAEGEKRKAAARAQGLPKASTVVEGGATQGGGGATGGNSVVQPSGDTGFADKEAAGGGIHARYREGCQDIFNMMTPTMKAQYKDWMARNMDRNAPWTFDYMVRRLGLDRDRTWSKYIAWVRQDGAPEGEGESAQQQRTFGGKATELDEQAVHAALDGLVGQPVNGDQRNRWTQADINKIYRALDANPAGSVEQILAGINFGGMGGKEQAKEAAMRNILRQIAGQGGAEDVGAVEDVANGQGGLAPEGGNLNAGNPSFSAAKQFAQGFNDAGTSIKEGLLKGSPTGREAAPEKVTEDNRAAPTGKQGTGGADAGDESGIERKREPMGPETPEVTPKALADMAAGVPEREERDPKGKRVVTSEREKIKKAGEREETDAEKREREGAGFAKGGYVGGSNILKALHDAGRFI